MARKLLGSENTFAQARSAANITAAGMLSGPRLQSRLRQRRSGQFIEQITKIDAGQHTHDRAALDSVIAAISAEFPDINASQRPLGIVSKCYLGHPYEVHVCDLVGEILEHFEIGRAMPGLFERARSLARHDNYSFIEVYTDTLIAVSADGTSSVIKR